MKKKCVKDIIVSRIVAANTFCYLIFDALDSNNDVRMHIHNAARVKSVMIMLKKNVAW